MCACVNALTDTAIQTWEQHSRYNFSILQHVNDATLEIFTAVGLQVATETENDRAKQRERIEKWGRRHQS